VCGVEFRYLGGDGGDVVLGKEERTQHGAEGEAHREGG